MHIRFASYNIHKAVGLDGKRDPDRIISVLREVDADIIALQEADRRFGQRASVLSRAAIDDTPWKVIPVAKQPRSIGWHGNAILIRRDFESLTASALDLPTLEPRGAVMGEIDAQGHRLRILGAHLDISGLRRSDQVRALLQDCAQRSALPTAILGDFNQWGRLTGAMRAFGISWQIITPGATYPAARPVAKLDRIVTTPDWDFVDCGVHHSAMASRASDHLPIWADLKLHKN